MFRLSLKNKWKTISKTLPEDQQTAFLKDALTLYSQSPENYFFIYAIANTIGLVSSIYIDNMAAVLIILTTLIHIAYKIINYTIKLTEFIKKWKN